MSEQLNYSQEMQKLSPSKGDLLVISVPIHLTAALRSKVEQSLAPTAERLGVELLVLEGGLTASLQPGMSGLMAEQAKQTALLERLVDQQALLIQAMAEDVMEDPDAKPLSYMDGSPCL